MSTVAPPRSGPLTALGGMLERAILELGDLGLFAGRVLAWSFAGQGLAPEGPRSAEELIEAAFRWISGTAPGANEAGQGPFRRGQELELPAFILRDDGQRRGDVEIDPPGDQFLHDLRSASERNPVHGDAGELLKLPR